MSKTRVVAYIAGLLVASISYAHASAVIDMKSVTINLQDQATLQRGAKIYMNYCSGCHSLHYMRYNRMAEDLGLTTFDGKVDTNLLVNNLIFTNAKINDPIQVSMPATDAREWFGMVPPDLSLVARERGAEWIYRYLKSFYVDKTRPFGTNNLLVPDVAMPNVLAPLLGNVIIVNKLTDSLKPMEPFLTLSEKGEMNQQQVDTLLEDLITFLVYVGEPVKLVRYRMGLVVLAFLSIFLIVALLLKKMYWKNIYHPHQDD